MYLHFNTLTTLKKLNTDDCPEGLQKNDDYFKVQTTLTKLKQDDCPEGFSKHEYVMNKLCKLLLWICTLFILYYFIFLVLFNLVLFITNDLNLKYFILLII